MASKLKLTELLYPTSTTPAITINPDNTVTFGASTTTITNLAYTGTLTGGTGVINIGSGQIYKAANGNVGVGTASPSSVSGYTSLNVKSTLGAEIQLGNTAGTAQATFWNDANGITYTNYATTSHIWVTAASERMRLDSSGNLGLGVTPTSGWSASFKVMQLGNQSAVWAANGQTFISTNNYNDGGNKYIGTGNATRYYQSAGQHIWENAPSGTAGNAISFTQAMTLDASGRLGLGVTSPGTRLDISGTIRAQSFGDGGSALILNDATGSAVNQNIDVQLSKGGGAYNYMRFAFAGTDIISWGSALSSYANALTLNSPVGIITFKANNADAARILSNGDFLVGTTSSAGVFTGSSVNLGAVIERNGGSIARQRNDDAPLYLSKASGYTNGTMIQFYVASTAVGSIVSTGSTTAYNTTSDYRLKENVLPMTGALAKVAALKPCTYTWKADGSAGQGFIAHELQAVVPECVVGKKDAVDKDGKPQYQGVDTSFLVATLTAAIQELKAEFDAYKASHP